MQGKNREAQLMGLTATVAQCLADAGPAILVQGAARAVGALLTAMEARGGGWDEDACPPPPFHFIRQ